MRWGRPVARIQNARQSFTNQPKALHMSQDVKTSSRWDEPDAEHQVQLMANIYYKQRPNQRVIRLERLRM
jgi:hypothetical protein